MAKKSATSLSGISIGLAFAALGLIYSFWLKQVYGSGTRYVAGVLVLFGSVFLLVEAQKLLTNSKLRVDNGGVGLLLLVPAGFGAYLVNAHMSGFWRGLLVAVLSTVAIFGLAGFIDLFVSAVENVQGKKDMLARGSSLLKFLTLLASSIATIVVALKQIG